VVGHQQEREPQLGDELLEHRGDVAAAGDHHQVERHVRAADGGPVVGRRGLRGGLDLLVERGAQRGVAQGGRDAERLDQPSRGEQLAHVVSGDGADMRPRCRAWSTSRWWASRRKASRTCCGTLRVLR
jgi:hypothetical protein